MFTVNNQESPMGPENKNRWMHTRVAAIIIVLSLLILVEIFDYFTGPLLNLAIAYFIPITYAAWALGRNAAFAVALFAEIPVIVDELRVAQSGSVPFYAAASNALLRLLIYMFVAETTARLANSTEDAREAARNLEIANQNLQSAYSRLDEDLRVAGTLQANMLSFTPPSVHGLDIGVSLRYAGQTGGDFADTGTVDGRIYICEADISGKGTPAALFTTLLKHLLSDAVRRGLNAVETIVTLNNALCLILPEDKFITLFYAEIDPENGQVEYINAGHTEGLIYRNRTGELEIAGNTMPLLGIDDAPADFSAKTEYLDDGDVMVIYSDGATDSRTADGNRLGDELIQRLVKEYAHLDAQEIADSICDRIEEIALDGSRDDLTLLCVRKTSN